jgi:nitroimidazol reductase NimA-like FMN-containing flavoprotein (pyridoxamine 5'-phosphate oxidase superfamily)
VADDANGPKLVALSSQECWELLGTAKVGRVGTNDDAGPVVIPVNFTVDGTDVVFRTREGGLLSQAAGWGRLAAFEVDRIDERREQGWSVLVRGELRQAFEDDAAELGPKVVPWAGGDRPVVGRIVSSSITGRWINHS